MRSSTAIGSEVVFGSGDEWGRDAASEPGEPSEHWPPAGAAALEMISAARAFLEVAEKVAQNPETVRSRRRDRRLPG